MKYKLVGCGGTFDLLHQGHKKFLDFVFAHGKKAIIGITSDVYLQEFKPIPHIQPFGIRKKGVEEYLAGKGFLDRAEIIALDDVFGSADDENSQIDALIATHDTLKGAREINEVRAEKNLPVLPIEICDFAQAEDGGIISSTRIRNGEINRDGRLYIKPEWMYQNFRLPEDLREELKKPFGKLIKNIDEIYSLYPEEEGKGENIVTVGDVVTSTFNQLKLNQKISVVDFIVKRHEKFHSLQELGFERDVEVFTVENPAGTISGKVIDMIQTIFEMVKKESQKNNTKLQRFVIQIKGEEDLTVLPIILTAPLGWFIFYGQPSEGIVQILIDEYMKEKSYKLFTQFEIVK